MYGRLTLDQIKRELASFWTWEAQQQPDLTWRLIFPAPASRTNMEQAVEDLPFAESVEPDPVEFRGAPGLAPAISGYGVLCKSWNAMQEGVF